MKVFDCYKIALHNIKNNKSRSILTTVIVYLMSLVIMGLLFVSISFSTNLNNINDLYIKDKIDYIITNYSFYQQDTTNALSKRYYDSVNNSLANSTNIDAVKYDSRNKNVVFTDYNHNFSGIIKMNSGVYPTNEGSNSVVVSKAYTEKYKAINGIELLPGSSFTYDYSYFDSRTNETKSYQLNVVVAGIFESSNNSFKMSSYQFDKIIDDNVELICNMNYIFDTITDYKITEAYFYTYVDSNTFNTAKFIKEEKRLLNVLNNILPKVNVSGDYENTVYNLTVEEMDTYNTLNIVFISLACFICLILALLSIGSLSNTIMISVNKNKRFIGLLKAMGVKQRSLEWIIRLEALTMIFIGILLSFITLVLLKPVLVHINEALLNSMVSYILNEINYTIRFYTPAYIPLIVFVFFILLTFLFSKANISLIANQDPISVISEVV